MIQSVTRYPSPATRHPLPATRHPPPATRHPPPATRHLLPVEKYCHTNKPHETSSFNSTLQFVRIPVISPQFRFAPSRFAPSRFAPTRSHFAPTQSCFAPTQSRFPPNLKLFRPNQNKTRTVVADLIYSTGKNRGRPTPRSANSRSANFV